MTKKFLNISRSINSKVNSIQQEKLGFFLLGTIFFSLVIYISTLNVAISSTYQKGVAGRDLKSIRQNIAARQEFFMAALSDFYEKHADSFSAADSSKELFVSRDSSVALRPGPILR